MPASLYDLDRTGSNGLDERTLQLAFELSMLGFGDHVSPSTMSSAVDDNLDVALSNHVPFPSSIVEEARNKKSQNMTECVPVPSSEHVAEIVGRQGCKIKALRAKTNTYIKTPVRGEEPVFVVTGRKEDVAKAKREILSAAEHFSQIRASRKTNLGGLLGGLSPPGPPANVPGQVTIQVRVPYRVVGLVVGPKGATIKRIQQQTHTYIVTPSRDKEPVFEVTGMPENVEAARREIEAHIAMRTGAGTLSLANLLGTSLIEDNTGELLANLCNSGLGSLFNYLDTNGTNNASASDALNMFPSTSLTSSASSGAFSSSGSISSSSSSSGGRLGDLVSIWNASTDRDEGLGESPGFDTSTTTSNIWSFPSSANTTGITTRPSPAASASPTDSLASLTGLSLGKRDCLVCQEKEVNAALVPCGHNLFCLDCASQVCDRADPTCPICSRTVCQAIRILS